MFEEILKHVNKRLDDCTEPYEFSEVLERCSLHLYELMTASDEASVKELNLTSEEFNKRNYLRWKDGFQKLEMLRQISIEAGMEFQKHFLSIPKYETDPMLGVLMRQHANACRITGEIILLLKGGYPDGAIARWRSLFEISVTCLVINKYGSDAAKDYIRHGRVKAVEGMEEYQKTAKEMNLQPYDENEISAAIALKEKISDGESHFHWARKYAGFSKLEKLREDVGLGGWSHNYKLASRNVHADYSEMLSLFAMSEAKQDMLLVGQSNSGMAEPAHMTAITLAQITSVFLTAHIHEDNELDYTNSTLFLMLIKHYVDAVGESFLKCSVKSQAQSNKPLNTDAARGAD
ncbi:hypothetical protein EGC76_11500 [Pseudidiomarina gelatinasegens]|uniref:Uncharacterized protein n=1 Tax=Pseudidiomarina gelatinasegens TaxID=2487740 RepID=A0A443YVX0_9GAMM|nr:DUF5677 domain-containing protein [Pseudidiomarina gelatinasegens]RWU08078.1 hypothetical protein EGC76_11500 [Pseudidiomarina gelatinasegens]